MVEEGEEEKEWARETIRTVGMAGLIIQQSRRRISPNGIRAKKGMKKKQSTAVGIAWPEDEREKVEEITLAGFIKRREWGKWYQDAAKKGSE